MKNICGECTLCCELFPVPAVNKKANELCKYCVLKKGCSIYNHRPKGCLGFDCAWLQMKKKGLNPSVELRPDKCKVIFEKINDKLFFGTQDTRYDLTDAAKGQINSFVKQGFSVILSFNQVHRYHLAKNHTIEQVNKWLDNFLEVKK